MAGSNIFMQLITATGPVIGEGLLQGWQGSIELKSFDWSMKYIAASEAAKSWKQKFGAAQALSMLGITPGGKVELQELTFEKRFDVASMQIHMCCDYNLPVVSANITVLHIKQDGRAVHQPAFNLMAIDGYIDTVDVKAAEQGSGGAEVVETVTMRFKHIEITYLKRFGKDNLPTAPFIYKQPGSLL